MSRVSFGEQPKDHLPPPTSPTHTIKKKKAEKKDWL